MIPKLITVGTRMQLRYYPTDTFKAGTLSLSVVLPIDPKDTPLTSLLLSVLLRGTKSYPTVSALNRRLDFLFGTELSIRNFYRGDCQVIGLCADMLEANYLPQGMQAHDLLEGTLEVMREILFCPLTDENGMLSAEYVESEKRLQCDTIRAQKNNPHAYAADRCRALMFEGEPCSVPLYGKEEEIMAVTPEQLSQHWRKLLASLSLHFFYIGTAEQETLVQTLHKTFAPELDRVVKSCAQVLSVSRHARPETVKQTCESMPVNQGHLNIGLHTGIVLTDHDFYACVLFNELLGASPVSKLFMNVRERLSLCYSCNSIYNAFKGTVLISCGLENENREKAETEIFAQIRAIAEGNFDDAEWLAAKKSLENAYRQLEDSPTALESYYFGRSLAGIKDSTEECREHIRAVTREDVIRVAKNVQIDTVFFLLQTGNGEETDDEED